MEKDFKLESKVISKTINGKVYFCACCQKVFISYKNNAWSLSPLKFSEFCSVLNVISFAEDYSEIMKIKGIEKIISLSEEEFEEFENLVFNSELEVKRISLEINFHTREAKWAV